MTRVRTEISRAELVVCLITPMYSSRPICLAEAGAAWGRTGGPGSFVPILARGVQRKSLEDFIFGSVCTEYSHDAEFLDALRDRIAELAAVTTPTAEWREAKDDWLTLEPKLVAALPHPRSRSRAMASAGDWLFLVDRGRIFGRVFSGVWSEWRPIGAPHEKPVDEIACASHGGCCDLFAVAEGDLYHSWAMKLEDFGSPGHEWNHWREAVAPIAASSMGVNHAGVFNFTADGRLLGEWWDGHEWNHPWRVDLPSNSFLPEGR